MVTGRGGALLREKGAPHMLAFFLGVKGVGFMMSALNVVEARGGALLREKARRTC